MEPTAVCVIILAIIVIAVIVMTMKCKGGSGGYIGLETPDGIIYPPVGSSMGSQQLNLSALPPAVSFDQLAQQNAQALGGAFGGGVANVPSAAIFGSALSGPNIQANKQQQAMNLQQRLGGFGTPVRNFNAVPALQQLQRLNNQRRFTNATIGNMYLQTANSGRIKNMM